MQKTSCAIMFADISGSTQMYDQLGDEHEQLRQRIDNDPRVVQATLEWSRCMGQAGYAMVRSGHADEESI